VRKPDAGHLDPILAHELSAAVDIRERIAHEYGGLDPRKV